jgi:hypothetical protein
MSSNINATFYNLIASPNRTSRTSIKCFDIRLLIFIEVSCSPRSCRSLENISQFQTSRKSRMAVWKSFDQRTLPHSVSTYSGRVTAIIITAKWSLRILTMVRFGVPCRRQTRSSCRTDFAEAGKRALHFLSYPEEPGVALDIIFKFCVTPQEVSCSTEDTWPIIQPLLLITAVSQSSQVYTVTC